jgi:hypothetical protein
MTDIMIPSEAYRMKQRRLAMKKTTVFLSMLAAALLLSAAPAFSDSGPYGGYGLSGNFFMAPGVETQHNVTWEGSGPYGLFGPSFKGIDTTRATIAGGSGPYGAFDNFGMRGGESSNQTLEKEKCLLVATVCPLDLVK